MYVKIYTIYGLGAMTIRDGINAELAAASEPIQEAVDRAGPIAGCVHSAVLTLFSLLAQLTFMLSTSSAARI
jgi:hypothetical protein